MLPRKCKKCDTLVVHCTGATMWRYRVSAISMQGLVALDFHFSGFRASNAQAKNSTLVQKTTRPKLQQGQSAGSNRDSITDFRGENINRISYIQRCQLGGFRSPKYFLFAGKYMTSKLGGIHLRIESTNN